MKQNNQTWLAIAVILVAASTPSIAADSEAPLALGTTVTSEQFKLDMAARQGVFTGNVMVVGKDFKMKATEMTVYFANGNSKVERLVAKGDVEIEQPARTAKSSQAEYQVTDDRMILTGSPEVNQDRNRITGTTITIYRSSNRMEIDGRSRVLLYDDLSSGKSSKKEKE